MSDCGRLFLCFITIFTECVSGAKTADADEPYRQNFRSEARNQVFICDTQRLQKIQLQVICAKILKILLKKPKSGVKRI